MANLINDSYVFGGGVKLQAQYQSATPVSVSSFTLRVQSSGGYKISGVGSFSAGTRTHTIQGDRCSVYSTGGTLNGSASCDSNTQIGTVAGGNISFGPGGMVVEVTTTASIGVKNVKALPGTQAYVYIYLT